MTVHFLLNFSNFKTDTNIIIIMIPIVFDWELYYQIKIVLLQDRVWPPETDMTDVKVRDDTDTDLLCGAEPQSSTPLLLIIPVISGVFLPSC